MKNELSERLKAEEEFQNQRTVSQAEGKVELRARFYFLIDRAKKYYKSLVKTECVDKNVLVAGCAEGGVRPLVRAGAKFVYGVDIASEPIARLSAALVEEGLEDKTSVFVGNAEDVDLPESSIDLVCCTGVLHHLDIEKAIPSWKRVLTDEGKVVMMEPLAMNPLIFLFRLATPSMRTDDEHPLVPGDFRYFKKHFKSVKFNAYVLTSLFSLVFIFSPELMKKVCASLEKLDDALLKVFPFLAHLAWTSTIELSDPIR